MLAVIDSNILQSSKLSSALSSGLVNAGSRLTNPSLKRPPNLQSLFPNRLGQMGPSIGRLNGRSVSCSFEKAVTLAALSLTLLTSVQG